MRCVSRSGCRESPEHPARAFLLVRLAVTFLIWESEWEILAVALKDLPRNNTAQLIPIDERYLLEVLP